MNRVGRKMVERERERESIEGYGHWLNVVLERCLWRDVCGGMFARSNVVEENGKPQEETRKKQTAAAAERSG